MKTALAISVLTFFLAQTGVADLPPIKPRPKTKTEKSQDTSIVPRSHKLEDFKGHLKKGMLFSEIVAAFGEPARDIGSGIHIYVYELENNAQLFIGVPGANVIYANVHESDGKTYGIIK